MSNRLGQQITGFKNCPNCGVASPVIVHVVSSQAPIRPSDGGRGSRWALYACTTCGQALMAKGAPVGQQDVSHPEIIEIFPTPKQAHVDIPENARQFLQQAYETLHAPDAAGVMAASAVDAMLKNLGYVKGSLYERIDKAAGDGVLTKAMSDWAHEVRLGANRPRHADSDKPHLSRDEAKQSVDFAEALGHFLFVLSARIERGIEAAKGA
jgi:hypothetical protein